MDEQGLKKNGVENRMLKKLEIDNFKSLVDFHMDLEPVTVVIGNNATGKSAILQAIDFLCSSVREDFPIIIERRNWSVENIKSKLASPGNNRINFQCEFVFKSEKGQDVHIAWNVTVLTNISKNQLHLGNEFVYDLDTREEYLHYVSGKGGFIKGGKNQPDILLPSSIELQSSVLKILSNMMSVAEPIRLLKRFLINSTSFELLSPSEMRLSSRGEANDIGMSGKNLPSFIKMMSQEQKKRFMEKLRFVLGDKIETIDAATKGKPGWTQINVQEKYQNKTITVNSKEMSDGILRVLAFIAISEIKKSDAVLLLDEIENGINTNYAENLLKVLNDIYQESGHQLILTTHSTVFLDYVDKDGIVYLYRNEQGETKAAKLFENKALREQLDYMWPGEVILNMSTKEIVEKILGDE